LLLAATLGRGPFRRLFGLGGATAAALGRFGHEDEVALADLVADADLDLLNGTRERGWHFHGGLVGFQGNQRVLGLNGVTGVDQDLNDIDGVEVADIGDVNFGHISHYDRLPFVPGARSRRCPLDSGRRVSEHQPPQVA